MNLYHYLHTTVLKSGILFLLVHFVFLPGQLNAQCSTGSNACADAVPLACGTFSGQLTDVPPMGHVYPGCPSNSIDNPFYYSFEVSATTDVTVTVTPSNCEGSGSGGGLGMQAALYGECDINGPNYGIQCGCTSGGMVFSAILMPGTYYVMIDGCAGDVCDFQINITPSPTSIPVSTPEKPTASNLTPCPNEIVTFSIPAHPAATNYTWVFPNDVTPIGSPPHCESVDVFWGQNSGNVSVIVSNDCSLPASSPPLFIESPRLEGYEYGYYCAPNEPGYYHAGTQTYYPSSFDIQWFTPNGCDSIIHLIIDDHAVKNNVYEEICIGGSSTEYAGHVFTSAIDTQLILPGAAIDGCDSIITISISEMENAEIASINITAADCDSIGGAAHVILSADTTNVSYNWSNGGTGSTQQGLAVGEYSVTVENFVTGCRSHRNLEVDVDTGCYVVISGYVFNDTSSPDCMSDSTSSALPNILVNLSNGMSDFTDQDGYYEFRVYVGTYEVSIEWDTTRYNQNCSAFLTVDALTSGVGYTDNNFYLEYTDLTDIGLKVSKLDPRPGFTRYVRICVMNYGTVPMDWTLHFVHDSLQNYVSANFTPDNYDLATQTLSWNYTNHIPGYIIVYEVQLTTPANIPAGTFLDYYFQVEPMGLDTYLPNNEISRQCIVVNSSDPNDKQVLPLGEGPLGGIRPDLTDSLLEYHIRFQNTGTDTAYTVVIRDTLDSDLSVRDVVPGPSSHPYDLDVIGSNILEFRFENIYLPDSSVNEPLSHGFLFYDVKLKRDLPVGTEINNSAAIYFDFNSPLITNTVTNAVFGEDVFTDVELEGCGILFYNNQPYTSSTVVTNSIDLIYYDSIVTANLTVFPEYNETVNVELLPGETYQGTAYFSDTTFVQSLQTVDGCDSTVTVVVDVMTTGIKTFGDQLINVSVSPNPSSALFNIGIKSSVALDVRWKLVNTIGEQLFNGSWKINGQSIEQLDLSAQPSGVYILLLESAGVIATQKLVKF